MQTLVQSGGLWIEMAGARMSRAVRRHLVSAVCIYAITSTRANLVTKWVWRICMCKDVLQWGIAWCWILLALLGWMISSLLLGGLRCIWGQWYCWSYHGAAIRTCSPPFGNSLVRVGGFVRPLRCISMPTCQLRHRLSARNKLPICLPRSWGTVANTKLEIVEAISHTPDASHDLEKAWKLSPTVWILLTRSARSYQWITDHTLMSSIREQQYPRVLGTV